jgi:hypothetical protein
MSKIKRLDDAPIRYGTSDDWLTLFAHEFQKQAYLENLKPIINRKSFSSIDEKMADIKNRIGFDVVSRLTSELDDLSKQSNSDIKNANKECDCNNSCCNTKKASSAHSEVDIRKMKNILEYINDMVKSEPHLSVTAVISRCRDYDGLGFGSLNIDHGRLKKYIGDLIEKYNNSTPDSIKYEKINSEPISAGNGFEQADYYAHARPVTG